MGLINFYNLLNVLISFKMESIFITTDISMINYPMGEYMKSNVPKIIKTIDTFKQIEEFKGRNLNIICRGSSGAIIAAIYSMNLPNEIDIIHVKKDGEIAHNGGDIRLMRHAANIIVDDFICSGETMNSIYTRIKRTYPDIIIDCVCVTGPSRALSFIPRYFICGNK